MVRLVSSSGCGREGRLARMATVLSPRAARVQHPARIRAARLAEPTAHRVGTGQAAGGAAGALWRAVWSSTLRRHPSAGNCTTWRRLWGGETDREGNIAALFSVERQ